MEEVETEVFRDDEFDFAKEPDQFDLFEAMDRTSQVFHHLESALHNHVGLNYDQATKVRQAYALLWEVYQIAGERFFEAQEN